MDIVNTPFDIPLSTKPFVARIEEFPTGDVKHRGCYIIAEGDSDVTRGTPLERKRYLIRLVVEHDPSAERQPVEFLVVPAGCPISDAEKIPPSDDAPHGKIMRLHFVSMSRNPYTDAIPVCVYRVEHCVIPSAEVAAACTVQ